MGYSGIVVAFYSGFLSKLIANSLGEEGETLNKE